LAVPERLPPENARLPHSLSLGGLIGSAKMTSLKTGGDELLGADGQVLKGAPISDQSLPTGKTPLPEYGLKTGQTSEATATGAGGTLAIDHRGAATRLSGRLGSVGEGMPGAVALAPISVGAGQRLELKPGRWSDLQAGVGYVLRKGAKILRRGTARVRP